ncbi:MAG: sulfatase [Pirellulales bacterium]
MGFHSNIFNCGFLPENLCAGFTRLLEITTATMIAMLLMSPSADADTASRPNVLFILCDDLRPDAVGCLGSKHVKTPHIDAVAADGVCFTNSFCTTSLCSPSRASILTGLYAHAHGVRNNFTELPANLATWPGRLQQEGYETAYIGKWHMGEGNDSPRPGFDWFVSHKGQGKYFDTEWNVNGQRRETPAGYYTTVVTDYCLDWLGQQQDKPWALCLGHKAPHSFYFPEPKYEHAFDDVTVRYPASAFALETQPDWIKQRLPTWHGIYGPLFDWRKKFPDRRPEAVTDFQRMVRAYWGTVLSVDDSVGRLVAFLKETGQYDNTVIVFMGDNGLLEGEHGMVDKRTMHEPSIRVPLIARGPGLPAGATVAGQVLTEDIAPSILDLCAAAPLADIDGRSWRQLAAGDDPDWRTAWVYEYDYEKQFPYTPNIRGIRTDRWKFVRYPHGDGSPDRHTSELYDLKTDPLELTNLAEDPDFAERRAELERRLATELAALGLTPESDTMPLDEGIKTELPDEKIR